MDIDGHPVPPKNVTGCHFSPGKSGYDISCPDDHRIAPVGYVFFFKTPEIQQSQKCISCTEGYCTYLIYIIFIFIEFFIYRCFVSVLLLLLQNALYWAVWAGLLTPLTFTRHRLSPLAAFYFRRTFFTMEGGNSKFANFTLPFFNAFLEARSQDVSGNKQ